MQNFEIKNNYLLDRNINQIKKLWLESFIDEDEKTVDRFLNTVFKNENGVGAFCGDELVAMILFLNSKIISGNKTVKSVYFYAVCTAFDYRNKGVMKSLFEFAKQKTNEKGFEVCFLVPEGERLFEMYQKLSFSRTVAYEEKQILRLEFNVENTRTSTTDFCYEQYLNFRTKLSSDVPVVVFGQEEFNFIYTTERADAFLLSCDFGYAVYSVSENEALVYELCGDKEKIINEIFCKEKNVYGLTLRLPSAKADSFLGMSFNLNGANDELKPIYFGIPYG